MIRETIGKYRWTICALLFFATTINYLDRQVLSLLKPLLEDKFGWSNSDYANIASVFQFTYAISMLFAGRIVDKMGTKSGYLWALIIWSIGAMLHALAIPIGTGVVAVLGTVGIYSMTMIGSIGGGWFPVYFIRKGYQPYDGRMRAMLLIAAIPLVVLLAQPLGHISYWLPVLLIGIGASAHQAWSANLFTTVSDMFPKKAVASVVGLGGMAGAVWAVLSLQKQVELFLTITKHWDISKRLYHHVYFLCDGLRYRVDHHEIAGTAV